MDKTEKMSLYQRAVRQFGAEDCVDEVLQAANALGHSVISFRRGLCVADTVAQSLAAFDVAKEMLRYVLAKYQKIDSRPAIDEARKALEARVKNSEDTNTCRHTFGKLAFGVIECETCHERIVHGRWMGEF